MRLEERLGRRKDEARKGLELAREKHAAGRLRPPAGFAKEQLAALTAFAKEVGQELRSCLVIGGDGGALRARAAAEILGKREGGMDLRVLDSAAPDGVREAARGFDLRETLFLLCSERGAAPELEDFYRYYRSLIDDGRHFAAIAESGSALHALAEREGFRRTFHHPAHTSFLLPAALLGADLSELAAEAGKESQPQAPLPENQALRLGAIAAGLARGGADKLTLLFSRQLQPLGDWVAQRVADAVVPVVGEPQGRKDSYGKDRLFISVALAGEPHDMSWLADAGHPVIQWKLDAPVGLAAAFSRWETAAAAMEEILEAAPEPPDDGEGVRALLAGGPPAAEPALRDHALSLFAGSTHAQILRKAAGTLGAQAAASAPGWIAAHLALADPGDCVALIAWLPQTLRQELNAVQGGIRDATGLACTLGFGPRFLRSGRRAGGGEAGIYILLTGPGGEDLPIPGRAHGFQALYAAGAQADFDRLLSGGRRALRVHAEDGKPEELIRALHQAIRLISK